MFKLTLSSFMTMFEPKGKVALVTGGVSGIGLAVGTELLENGLKALVLVDINDGLGNKVSAELKIKYKDSDILFVRADVGDKNSLEGAFRIAVRTFIHLDIVVNSAGVRTEKLIETVIDVNYKGTVYGCILGLDHYLPKYKTGDEAIILNISSLAGLIPVPSLPIYSSSKWAVVGLTRSLGTDAHYERTKVKVVTLCPGFTDTPLLGSNINCFLDSSYEELYDTLIKNYVIQSVSTVGKTALFIITEGSNGSVWLVDANKPPQECKFPDVA